jgi:hypothetical protein
VPGLRHSLDGYGCASDLRFKDFVASFIGKMTEYKNATELEGK